MAAIRIIDDHLELANIGSNTHAQIDTHIAAADDYVKRDGSLALTADWDIGDGRKILADEMRARDAAGLKLYDDGGNGIFVKDGGEVEVVKALSPMVSVHDTNQSTKDVKIGVVKAGANSYPGVWFQQATPDVTNYAFLYGGYTIFNSPAGTQIAFRIGNANKMRLWSSGGLAIGDSFYATDPGTDDVSIEKDLSIRATTATRPLDINSSIMRLRSAYTPASAGAAGYQGDLCWDADYFYICVATNTWQRAAHATW